MAPVPSSQNGKSLTNGVVHDQLKVADSREKSVRDLVTLLSNALNAAGTEDLTSLIGENESLKKNFEDEKAARRVRDAEFRDEERSHQEKTVALEGLQREVMQFKGTLHKERNEASKKIAMATEAEQGQKKRADDAEKLYTKQMETIKNQETAINRAKEMDKKSIARETEATNKIKELERELEGLRTNEKQLTKFKSYGLETKTVKAHAGELSQALKLLFDVAARSLRELVFEHEMDFSADALEAWDAYKQKSRAVTRLRIPLPEYNSLLAKQMRYSSSLAVLGRILCDQIFQPVYSSTENDWIMESLRTMAENNETEKEHHLRSILLKISPEEQVSVGRQRAKAAYKHAQGILSLIVAEDRVELLHEKLLKVCEEALKIWFTLQKSQEHVVADIDIGTEEDWTPLDLPGYQQSKNSGNTSTPGKAKNNPGRSASSPRTTEAIQRDEDIGPAVWPVFTAEDEVLCRGYYLKFQHIQEARREQRETEDTASSKSFRRPSRSNTGSISKKTNAFSFLSKGGS